MEVPQRFIREELGNLFAVKEKSIGRPTQYLGNKVSHITLEDGTKCWSLSSSQYIQNVIRNVRGLLISKHGIKLPIRAKSPWTSNYRPETDISSNLPPAKATYYTTKILSVIKAVIKGFTDFSRIGPCVLRYTLMRRKFADYRSFS